MPTLDELLSGLKPQAMDTANIDMSEWFGEGAQWRFREPSAAERYGIAEAANKLKRSNPMLPDSLLATVVLLSICLVEPTSGEEPAHVWFMRMAEQQPRMFTYVDVSFQTAMPHLSNLIKAAEERKNASGTASTETS